MRKLSSAVSAKRIGESNLTYLMWQEKEWKNSKEGNWASEQEEIDEIPK